MMSEVRRGWHTVKEVEGNCRSQKALARAFSLSPSLSLSRVNYYIYIRNNSYTVISFWQLHVLAHYKSK